jgi:dTDP-4-amino-4,6-dideoxygalactose transaminase
MKNSTNTHMIPLFKPKYRTLECIQQIQECFENNWTGLGYKTLEFEKAWSEYTKLPHSHFINSNSVGLQLALKVFANRFSWGEETEIISSPITFVSTNHAILLEGFNPVFADVDEMLCMDAKSVSDKISKNTKAVVFIGIGGNTGQLSEIQKICKENDLLLILDAAHMAGTYFENQHVGKGVDCTVFSFQAVKNLPIADAGMICFANEEDDFEVRKMSWLGINKDTFSRNNSETLTNSYKWLYDVEHIGLKANGNSIMAGIGLVQLKYLDEENDVRRDIAIQYIDLLRNIPEIELINHADDCRSSRHLMQIKVPAKLRESLISYLGNQKISVGVHYRSNTRYKMYQKFINEDLFAEVIDQQILSLPLHLDLTADDLKRVTDGIRGFFRGTT